MSALSTPSALTAVERQWLREQLHGEAMCCRQCRLVTRLLAHTERVQGEAGEGVE